MQAVQAAHHQGHHTGLDFGRSRPRASWNLRQHIGVLELSFLRLLVRMHEPVSQVAPLAHHNQFHLCVFGAERLCDPWPGKLFPPLIGERRQRVSEYLLELSIGRESVEHRAPVGAMPRLRRTHRADHPA